MAKPTRVYWDACTWIAFINQETEVIKPDGSKENRFAMCLKILKDAQNDEIEIVTSAFTLAEVCKNPVVKDSPLDHLPSFFEKSYILIVPVDMAVGIRAQIMQTSGLANLKPPDAIHLASAQRAAVLEFHTFDEKILNLDSQITLPNGTQLKICKPTEGKPLGPLFDKANSDDQD